MDGEYAMSAQALEVSIRSRNGAPSRKECVVNGQTTQAYPLQTSDMYAPSPSLLMPHAPQYHVPHASPTPLSLRLGRCWRTTWWSLCHTSSRFSRSCWSCDPREPSATWVVLPSEAIRLKYRSVIDVVTMFFLLSLSSTSMFGNSGRCTTPSVDKTVTVLLVHPASLPESLFIMYARYLV